MSMTMDPFTVSPEIRLAARVATFETWLRGLTVNHPTDKALRIIGWKVKAFVAELEEEGILADINTRIGRHGVVVTGKLKE